MLSDKVMEPTHRGWDRAAKSPIKIEIKFRGQNTGKGYKPNWRVSYIDQVQWPERDEEDNF